MHGCNTTSQPTAPCRTPMHSSASLGTHLSLSTSQVHGFLNVRWSFFNPKFLNTQTCSKAVMKAHYILDTLFVKIFRATATVALTKTVQSSPLATISECQGNSIVKAGCKKIRHTRFYWHASKGYLFTERKQPYSVSLVCLTRSTTLLSTVRPLQHAQLSGKGALEGLSAGGTARPRRLLSLP